MKIFNTQNMPHEDIGESLNEKVKVKGKTLLSKKSRKPGLNFLENDA
ncbi:hypothetical protein LME01_11120 [Leuconostoc mesenteroides subsp. mesenteroides]|nr:hypothetical protein LME01_11120 [Leuconostoc mesenteroides subsp. mesenteroides]